MYESPSQKIVKDKAKFLMPKSRELQFPAMAVMQTYVNDYQKKNYFLGMQQLGFKVDLEYCIDIASEDWKLFQDVGLELEQQPVEIFHEVDLLVDLTEERLAQFSWRKDQHVAQIYGALIGVETTVLPKIRKKQLGGTYWFVLSDGLGISHIPRVDTDTLVTAADGYIRGVIGQAGWETYLACAMGLPVIEIKPPDRASQYLSKWTHPFYRMIDGNDNIADQIIRAIDDLEKALCTVVQAGATIDPMQTVQ